VYTLLRSLIAGWLFASPVAIRAEEPATLAALAFEQLSRLVGAWESSAGIAPPHSVEYRLSGSGSVLVETWALGPGRESLTLYHLDGERLLATHYCLQGNQPRLQLVKREADEFHFELRDGTNLQVAGRSHQHAFWLRLTGLDSLVRSETYVDNGSAGGEGAVPGDAISYTRRRAPGS
jgi:hypothetical protein